ncbi:hypothetical protein V8C34DRAFT_138299 [Trichoderma compactum]
MSAQARRELLLPHMMPGLHGRSMPRNIHGTRVVVLRRGTQTFSTDVPTNTLLSHLAGIDLSLLSIIWEDTRSPNLPVHGPENIPLNFDKPRKALVQKNSRDVAKNMFLMASNTLQEFTASPQGINASDREALINFNAYREGILMAFDFCNPKMLYTNVDEIFGRDVFNISKAPVSIRDSQTITKSQQRLFQRASKDDMPTVGVEHVQQLLGFDNNCGLDYAFTRACLDPDVFLPR